METRTSEMLATVDRELQLTEDELLQRGLRSFLRHELREVDAQILELRGRYGAASVEEMDARYREGTLEEVHSWRDLQRFDHLEYERDRLQTLLDSLA